jgi:hypothetical protein
MPATLPCPKMPKQPAKKRLLHAVALDVLVFQKRMRAWAIVIRRVDIITSRRDGSVLLEAAARLDEL